MSKKKKCKTCAFWCNEQRELNYWNSTGFCTNPKLKFTVSTGRMAGVFDRENQKNRSVVKGNPSHDFETTRTTERYSLATDENFGCVIHVKKGDIHPKSITN